MASETPAPYKMKAVFQNHKKNRNADVLKHLACLGRRGKCYLLGFCSSYFGQRTTKKYLMFDFNNHDVQIPRIKKQKKR